MLIILINQGLRCFFVFYKNRIYRKCARNTKSKQSGFRTWMFRKKINKKYFYVFCRFRSYILHENGLDMKVILLIDKLYCNKTASIKLEGSTFCEIQIWKRIRSLTIVVCLLFTLRKYFQLLWTTVSTALGSIESWLIICASLLTLFYWLTDRIPLENVNKKCENMGMSINIKWEINMSKYKNQTTPISITRLQEK